MMNQAWPYIEAEKVGPKPVSGVEFLFETGYGPSGLPHIGTFTEVLRTTMVQRAHAELYPGTKSRLIVFSDDLDGMRRAPTNVPNQEMLKEYEGVSLSRVPDPFGCCASFAAHNNAQLRRFLDDFGFEYEFRSAYDMYRNEGGDSDLVSLGFQGALRVFHLHHDMIAEMVAETMGHERAATYSPFMPIDPETGHVYQVPILGHDVDGERIQYLNPRTGEKTWTSILKGNCKLQWKADWAMRWFAQEIDYEMAGKDLTDSVKLSSEIVRAIGWKAPKGFIYEMFLDRDGKKISKSVGNGMTIDDWLRYGTRESLMYYLYREPTKAKKLHEGLVPQAVDQLWKSRREYFEQTPEQQQANPVHHIPGGLGVGNPSLTYSNLVNLVKLVGADRISVIEEYAASFDADSVAELRNMIPLAVNYFRDHIEPELEQSFHVPDAPEREALMTLAEALSDTGDVSEANMQFTAFEVGKNTGYADRLRDWFKLIYQTVFGYPDGPRIGQFIAIYGRDEFVALLRQKIGQ